MAYLHHPLRLAFTRGPATATALRHTLAGLRLPVLALVSAMTLAGCGSLRGVPTRYQPTDDIVTSINLVPADLAELQSAADEKNRNQLQNKAVAVIDLQFHQFARGLANDRADMAAGAAGTTLGATTAGAFVESVKAKTNYALFAAAAIGAVGIVDKNYYYEKTVPALVAAMGAARASVLVRIRNGQSESIANYPGVAALADLEDYFSAGTVLAAIAEITARAESDKQASLAEVRSIDVPTDDEIARRKRLSKAIFAIDDKALPKAKTSLAALGLAEQKTVKETRLELLRAMRPPTKARLDLVEKALTDAGLLN